MRQLNHKILLLFVSLFPAVLFAQSIKDVRINEIQVFNINSKQDEYGRFSSWIELANCGFNKVNVGGCYLKVNGKEYRIPQGDPKTIVPTQGFIVFYAAGDNNDKGTFYTNFTLKNTDFVTFHDIEGRLIDSLTFNPQEMLENVSYGWLSDHDAKEKRMNLPATTPGASNNTLEKTPRSEIFRQADPSGLVLTITSIAVVAIVLILLFFIFKIMGNYNIYSAERKEKKGKAAKKKTEIILGLKEEISEEELAAFAIALYKYSEELQDIEDNILTINRVAKAYSPWNSKIYGLTRTPQKKSK